MILLNFSLPFRPLPSSRPFLYAVKQSKTAWQKPGRTRLIQSPLIIFPSCDKAEQCGWGTPDVGARLEGWSNWRTAPASLFTPQADPSLLPPPPPFSRQRGKLDSSSRAGALSSLCSANQVLYRGTCTMLTCFAEKLLLWWCQFDSPLAIYIYTWLPDVKKTV